MFSSRDSFLTLRTENAVRMDITDTLWRRNHLNQNQDALLASTGKDIIARLSRFFSDDPIVQRLDVIVVHLPVPAHQRATAARRGVPQGKREGQ